MHVRWNVVAVLGLAVLAGCGSSSDPTPVPVTYSIGGSVTGLTGAGLVLASPGQADLAVSAGATGFTFATRVATGTAYAVTVRTHPAGQACTVTNGSGTVGSANVTSVEVTCGAALFSVGGTVSGLTGTGLVLATAGQANLPVAASATSFAFATRVPSGTAYAVTVVSQPSNPTQTCTVSSGTGTVGSGDVTGIAVICATEQYSVGGTVNGLTGSGLVLASPGLNDLTVAAGAGTFTFSPPVPSGTAYAVTVKTQPSGGQTCSVSAGTGTVASANVTSVVVNCAADRYTVGGTVSGLAGTGLVLQTAGQADLPVTNPGTFAFATPVATGTTYGVTVKTQPAGPAQTCVVANGTGTVASANVTNVTVTCTTNTYALGGTVSGLTGTGLTLSSPGQSSVTVAAGATTFSFGSLPSGTAYGIAVATQPTSPSQTCVVANGNGTIGAAPVSNVTVTCTTNTYALGGTVTGLEGSGLQLRYAVGVTPITVTATTTGPTSFTFGSVPSGTAYAVTVAAQPTGPAQTCTVTGGGTGTVTTANVASVQVTCVTPTVMQSWTAPSTWGGTASGFWSDSETGLVQHAVATATGMQETKLVGVTWTQPAGEAASIGSSQLDAFGPGLNRYGRGPFLDSGANVLRYDATGDSSPLNLTGDILVCAVVQPDWNPGTPGSDGIERVIMAKGKQGESGWVLMQMHESFCFHYQGQPLPSGTGWTMNWTFTNFPNNIDPRGGPNNTSMVVVCGGRHGDEIMIAANNVYDTLRAANPNPVVMHTGEPMVGSLLPASIGGYADNDNQYQWAGTIYETAVWNLPATAENIQAKMAEVLGGVSDAAGRPLRYVRNRDAAFPSPNAPNALFTQWRHGPRLDASKGLLFGLQGSNRVPYPESFSMWTSTGNVSLSPNIVYPPYGTTQDFGNNAGPAADELTLAPPSARVSVPLGTFFQPGWVQGQVWVYPIDATAASIDISTVTRPGTTSEATLATQTVNLGNGGLTAGQWSRVYINQLTTTATTTVPEGLVISRNSGTPHFYVWGVAVEQVDGADASQGSNLPDPGPTMYNSFINGDGQEYLELPALTESTAATGFCLSVTAEPAAGHGWTSTAFGGRGLISWHHATTLASAGLQFTGSNLVFRVHDGVHTSDQIVVPSPSQLTAGPHTLKACQEPGGLARIYVDGAAIGEGILPALVNIAGGTVKVGSAEEGHWQGYVKSARVCRNAANPASCN